MSRLRTHALSAALLVGVLADLLLRADGRPGLNAFLMALAGATTLWLLARLRPQPVSSESRWLVLGAVGFAALLMLRDAEALAVFDLFAILVLLGLAAGRGAIGWARQPEVQPLFVAAARVAALMVLGPLGWSFGPGKPAAGGHDGWRRLGGTVIRGVAMALPPLLVLVALLSSADAVFAALLQRFVSNGIEPLLGHLAFAALMAWFASGYLRAALVPDPAADVVRLPRPALSPAEPAIALSLLALLFLAFLAVQARYLFGGADVVALTVGLGYAEYARRGFFELVAAIAFVVPLLLLADWAAADGDGRARRALRAVSLLLVALLAGVMASAVYRMHLYQQAYGLTESRVYACAIVLWLAGVLAWLVATVLRGRRRGFAFGAILGGLACLAGLHVLNPEALVARVNLSRAAAGLDYDGPYLRTLGADAVPALLTARGSLPPAERCRIEARLRAEWSGARPGGWRTWNLADARARALVARSLDDEHMDRPAAMACDGRNPGRGVAGGVAEEAPP